MISCSIRIPKLTGGQTTKQVKFILSLMIVILQKTKLSYLILNHHCQSWNLQFIQFIPSQTCQARGQQPHFILFLDTSPFAASNATALHRAVGNEVEVLTVPKALPPMEEPLQNWLQAPEVAEAISKMLGKNDQKIGGDEAPWFLEIWWYQIGDRYSRSFIDSLDCPSTGWQEFQHCLAVEYVSNFEYLSMPGCLSHQKTTTHFFYRNWFSNSGNASIVCFNQGFRSTFEDGPTTPMASLHQHDEAYTCLACPLSWWLQPPLRGWTAVGGWYGFLVVCHPWLQCTRTQCCSY